MITYTNEDCMVGMARYPDKYFDLAIVDPPYGIETTGNAQDRFRMGMQLDTVNDMKPSGEYFSEIKRVAANQIIWGYNHLSDLLPSCREFIFWYKHQPVVTFSDGELAWTSFRKTAKCFDYPYWGGCNTERNRIHPTQKPVALYKWILTNYAKPGYKIIDTHVGSASSLIACYDMGFDAVGFELDPDYYAKSKQRLEDFMRQPKLEESIEPMEQMTL